MKHKLDRSIGIRAVSELYRLHPGASTAELGDMVGCNRESIYSWLKGAEPGAYYLAKMHALGADVIWILTGGKRK